MTSNFRVNVTLTTRELKIVADGNSGRSWSEKVIYLISLTRSNDTSRDGFFCMTFWYFQSTFFCNYLFTLFVYIAEEVLTH